MEVWSGDIHLRDGTSFKDIHIFSPQSSNSSPIGGFSKLQFLSEIVVSEVPFAIVAGPSYHVWTESIETAEWVSQLLLKEPPLESPTQSWFDVSLESYSGLLFRPEYNDATASEVSPITELLFYAIRDSESSANNQTSCLKVLALPLCSHQIKKTALVTALPISDDAQSQFREPNEVNGIFLSDDSHPIAIKKKDPKDIFETANELRRKASRRGGAGIQAAAAGVSQARLLVGHKKEKPALAADSKALRLDTNSLETVGKSLQSPALSHIKQPLRRSPSLPLSARPHSRKESQDLLSRTPLSRSITQYDPPLGESILEASNKDIMSRLIMAGMRLHGLQLRKKSDREKDATVKPADQTADDEFKMIYHQTYKALTFTFVSLQEFKLSLF
jgi:DNA replication regulator SLD7